MPPRTTVYIESLGCAKNQVDSEVMLGCLEQDGCVLTSDMHTAEIIIINTCAFIAEATRESIDTILEYAALKRSGSCRALIVCGCLPQRYREDVAAELPEVDLFLGSSEYARIAEHIRELNRRPIPGPRLIIGKRHFCNPRTRRARFQRPDHPPTSRSPKAVRTAAPTARFRPSRARSDSARAARLCRKPAPWHAPAFRR